MNRNACAWCLASFSTRGMFSSFTAPVHSLRESRLHVIHSRRRRARGLQMPRMCNEPHSSDASSADENDEGDESTAPEEGSGFGSGDFTDPRLFVDMDTLRRRIREVESEDDDDDDETVEVEVTVGSTDDEANRLVNEFEQVKNLWVILYSSRDRKDGVYSLSLGGENIVLAFQERAEAQKYAKMLEAQDFPSAKVCRFDSAELREFCQRENLRLGFVPRGSLVDPPTESAISDKSHWHIGSSDDTNTEPTNGDNDGSSGLSQEEIDLMKRRLDNLFGK